ncbi:hypothetical protein [Mammaliicoccus sciuri]|uniref:hypothetical protein n=1 Tax=Mammaliicoccus sciuri TaxID=1296 RepID=UPI003F550531
MALPNDYEITLLHEDMKGTSIPTDSSFNKHDIMVLKKAIKDVLNEENFNKKEVGTMSEYITKDAFEQFEKRIDSKLETLDKKVDSLPSSSDIKVMLLENNKELKKESKQDRNTIIGWTIGIIGLGFTIVKSLGLI